MSVRDWPSNGRNQTQQYEARVVDYHWVAQLQLARGGGRLYILGGTLHLSKGNLCCVFRQDLGCCAHPKAGRSTFFSCFQPFFFFLNIFSEFPPKIKNHLKKTFIYSFLILSKILSGTNSMNTFTCLGCEKMSSNKNKWHHGHNL